jgi:hypothetical protein
MRFITLFLCAAAAYSQTRINDKAAAEKLLGAHNLTLQWLIYEKGQRPGTVTITNENGTYKVKGEQRGKGTDVLTIDGRVMTVNALDFVFQGKIVTRVSYIAAGKECVRDGTFTFRISGARQFWRIKEQSNPCDEAADYVDISFARPK